MTNPLIAPLANVPPNGLLYPGYASASAAIDASVEADIAHTREMMRKAREMAEAEAHARAQAEAAAAQQAAAQAVTPTASDVSAAAAQTPPAPGTSAWSQYGDTRFAKEFLPRNQMSLMHFAALPWEQREELATRYIAERSASEQLPEAHVAELTRAMRKIVYADDGGREPGVMSTVLDNDAVDKAWSTLRGMGSNLVAGGLSYIQADKAAQAVRDWNAAGVVADQKDFNAFTRNSDRIRARDAQLNKAKGEQGAMSEFLHGAGEVGASFVRNPLATAGELAGGVIPTAVAMLRGGPKAAVAVGAAIGATSAREQSRAAIVNGDFSTVPNWDALVKQAGSELKAKHMLADAVIDDAGQVGMQALSGAIGGVGGVLGVERMFGKAAANQLVQKGVRTALQRTGMLVSEGVQGALEGGAATVGANLAMQDAGMPQGTFEGVAGAVGEGAMSEALGGAVVAGARAAWDPRTSPVVAPLPTPVTSAAPTAAPAVTAPAAAAATTVNKSIDVIEPIDAQLGSADDVMRRLHMTADMTPEKRDQLNAELETFFGELTTPTITEAELKAAFPSISLAAPIGHTEKPAKDSADTLTTPSVAVPSEDTMLPDNIVEPLNVAPQDARDLLGELAGTLPDGPVKSMSFYLARAAAELQRVTGTPLGVTVTDNLMGEVTAPNGNKSIESLRGQYVRNGSTRTHHIELDRTTGRTIETLHHEVTHAVTLGVLETDPLRRSAVQNAAVADLTQLHVHALQQEWSKGFDIPNVYEFASEALANPRMQAAMKATPYSRELTVWGKFKSNLRKILGMDNDKVPDDMLEATLVASDAIVRDMASPIDAGIAKYLKTPARQRRDPPVIPELLNSAGDIAAKAQSTATLRKTDFMSSKYSTDPKTTARGSAFLLDAEKNVWQAQFVKLDGTQVNAQFRGISATRAFLQRFRETLPDGTVTKATVTHQSDNSGYRGTYNSALTQLDGLSDRMRTAYNALTAIHVRPDIAYSAVSGASSASSYFMSRLGGLDAFGATADLKSKSMFLRSQARAGIASEGLSGDASFATRADNFYASVESVARDANIPMPVISDYFYARSAMQSNDMKARTFPVDAAGRVRDKDFSAFSYVDDNGETVKGADAASKFVEKFNAEYPGHVQDMNDLVGMLKANNKYVLDTMLASGAIGPEQHAQYMVQDLYLPMQQLNKRPSGAVKHASGRYSKAQDPLVQWRAVSEARLLFAADRAAVLAVAREMQRHPNLNIGIINGVKVEAKPLPEVDADSGQVLTPYQLRSLAWDAEGRTTVWDGDRQLRLDITNKTVLDALRPAKDLVDAPAITQAAGIATRAFATMLTSPPAFWLMSASWDLGMLPFVMQGSFRKGGVPLTPQQSRDMLVRTYANVVPALAGSLGRTLDEALGRTVTSNNPMRKLYNAYGGGIRLGAATDTSDVLRGLDNKTRVQKLGAYGKQAFNILNAPGHIVSDAVRFAAFRAYMEQQYGGKFESAAEIEAFVKGNPDVAQQAALGSKMVLGNYEDTGRALWLRAVVPFYNASTVGFQHTLVNATTTTEGRKAMYIMLAVATLAAMAALDADDDEAKDGYSSYMRRQSSWNGLQLGDFVLPVPPEFRMLLGVANMTAALASDKNVDMPDAYDKMLRAALMSTPAIPGAASVVEGRPIGSEFGVLGILASLTVTNVDGFGRSYVSDQAKHAPTQPYYVNPRNSDSADAVQLSQWLWETARINVPPGKVDTVVRAAAGQWEGLYRERALGRVDGRGEEQAMIDWLTKGYNWSKPSDFDTYRRWEHTKGTIVRDEQSHAKFMETDKQIDSVTRGLGKDFRARAAAVRTGDPLAWKTADDRIKATSMRADVLRRDFYQSTGNQNRNLLD